MSLTISTVRKSDVDNGQRIVADVTFDSSYPWGGEAITAQDLGFRIGSALDLIQSAPVDRYLFEFLPDASYPHQGKLRVLNRLGDDFVLNRPGLAIGSVSKAEVLVGNAITYSVAGVLAELASAEHAFTATTHDITADASKIQEAIYLLSVAGGTLTITKGTTADEDEAVPPSLPAGEALVGYVKIQVEAGTTDFDATSDDLDASHLTVTYHDANLEVLEATDLSAITARIVAHGR